MKHYLASRSILLLLLAAGVAQPLAALAQTTDDVAPPTVPVTATAPALNRPAQCSNRFLSRDLPHVTRIAGDVVRMFDANGAGVAAGDLDGDGDLDLLLGNQDGQDTLLWNQGDLVFRAEAFSTGKTRDVKLVDVDADGRLDVVLTRNLGALNYFRNEGDGRFKRLTLPGVAAPAYVANWADLDRDGDLDLVTATYDAGLLTGWGSESIVGNGSRGVYYYENDEGRFSGQALAGEAQALAVLFPDLDGDGRQDILIGNDFLVPDRVWLRTETGWDPAAPFPMITHSTMSLDQGDINNDGRPEIFATDMKPYAGEDMADWAPVMDDMLEGVTRQTATADPQIMENVLQVPVAPGQYYNLAPDWGISGTGWSWSSKFGDLDNDGLLDLYVVNGMIEERLFGHMPMHELVERNQAFRNEQGLRFSLRPDWKLDSSRSGRGMVMADLDLDGDLDIVVNNLRGAAQLFENRLCGGNSLEVELLWPQSKNIRSIGAQVILHTSSGPLLRDVRAGSGYLSGDASRLHFGFGRDTVLEKLEIIWPDGGRSVMHSPPAGTLMTVTR